MLTIRTYSISWVKSYGVWDGDELLNVYRTIEEARNHAGEDAEVEGLENYEIRKLLERTS